MFGQTVTASGDTMRQHANAGLGSPRKWIGADIECDAGCGVVPFRYREQSYVNALQWTIGLELFLLVDDPWRVVLTTDHPNGGPFTSYPHLIRLLMDKPFRDEQLAQLHPDVAAPARCARSTRELHPLRDRDHDARRAGAAARPGRPRPARRRRGGRHRGLSRAARCARRMFTTPAYVFKDGVLVARDGRIVATPVGGDALRRARLRPRHRATHRRAHRPAARPALRATRPSATTSCAAAATAAGCCRRPASRGAV